eukprot:SAG11_NODE_17146_length_527_cov_0.745327_1_plen_126_part_10
MLACLLARDKRWLSSAHHLTVHVPSRVAVIELMRKLILTGIIGLVGRGPVAQAFVGAMISFYFFALSLRYQPYRKPVLNRMKIVVEFQVFATLTITIVLQSVTVDNFDAEEIFTTDDYGNALTVLT